MIWHRVALPSVQKVDEVVRISTRIGAKLVFDLDDNLLAMDEHPEREQYRDLVSAVERSVKVADVVWCSTEPLRVVATECGGAAAEWMPNVIDPEVWAGEPMESSTSRSSFVRLLYMGTRTHDEDFMLIRDALEQLHAERPDSFSLTLIGVAGRPLPEYRWLSLLSPPAYVGASYPAFVRWLLGQQDKYDIGLAPLADTAFNRCKSSIKVLDYAGLGLPTLASRVPAYSLDADRDRILVDNEFESWHFAFSEAIEERLPLAEVAARARGKITSQHFERAVERRWSSIRALLD